METKDTRGKLSEEQKKFEAIYQHSHDAIMLLTEKGFFDCNRRTLEMFGFKTVEDFSKVHPADISPPQQPDGKESFPAAMEHIKIALKNGYDHFEWVHKKTNGENFYADVLLSSFLYGGENVLQATVRDITSHKNEEEIIKKEKEQDQILLDSIPAWIFFKDKENKFIQANKSFCEVMGVTKEQLEGKSLFDFYPKEQAEMYWKDDKEVMTSGEAKMNIIEPITTPKGLLWVQTDKIPFRNTEGDVVGIIGFSIDITAQKKAEGETKKKNEEMEQMNTLMVGRELRMIDLKKEIAVLEEKIKKLEK